MIFRMHKNDRILGDVAFREDGPPRLEPAPGQEEDFARSWASVSAHADPAGYLDHYSHPNRRGRGFWAERLSDEGSDPLSWAKDGTPERYASLGRLEGPTGATVHHHGAAVAGAIAEEIPAADRREDDH